MSPLWNFSQISKPEALYCIASREDLDSVESLLEETTKKVSECRLLNKKSLLCIEFGLFSQLVYKVKCTFRNQRHLQELLQVRKYVRRLLRLKMDELLKEFLDTIKTRKKSIFDDFHLPSRDHVEFIMNRLQGLTVLLVRTIHHLQQSYIYTLHKVHIHHYLGYSFFLLSLCAGLWSLIQTLILKCVDLYQVLEKLGKNLKQCNSSLFLNENELPSNLLNWLKENYNFQETIEKLMDAQLWYYENKIKELQNSQFPRFPVINHKDVILNKYFEEGGEEKEIEILNENPSSGKMEDEIEIIDLCKLDLPAVQNENSSKETSLVNLLQSITSCGELVKFVKDEKLNRKAEVHFLSSFLKEDEFVQFRKQVLSLIKSKELDFSNIQKKLISWLENRFSSGSSSLKADSKAGGDNISLNISDKLIDLQNKSENVESQLPMGEFDSPKETKKISVALESLNSHTELRRFLKREKKKRKRENHEFTINMSDEQFTEFQRNTYSVLENFKNKKFKHVKKMVNKFLKQYC